MDVGGGGGACVIILCNCNFLRGVSWPGGKKSEGKEIDDRKRRWKWMLVGGGIVNFFLREDELARWYPPQKKIFFFFKVNEKR